MEDLFQTDDLFQLLPLDIPKECLPKINSSDFTFLVLKGGSVIFAIFILNGFSYIQYKHKKDVKKSVCIPAQRSICPISATYQTVILLNFAVYMAWKVETWKPLMENYFVFSSFDSIKTGVISLILPSFSHKGCFHLFGDMLLLFGTLEVWRPRNHSRCTMKNSCHGGEFISFCLASCIASSLGGTLVKMFLDIKEPSFGASGLVCSLVAYELCVIPQVPCAFQWPVGQPIASKDVLRFIVMFDLFGLTQLLGSNKSDSELIIGADYATHLSGYIFGALYANGLDSLLLGLGRVVAHYILRAVTFL